MRRIFQVVPALVMAGLVGGCGTLVEGEHARLDHWGPLPVVCLGECSALDPYYYDKQQASTEKAADTSAPTAEPDDDRTAGREVVRPDTSPGASPVP